MFQTSRLLVTYKSWQAAESLSRRCVHLALKANASNTLTKLESVKEDLSSSTHNTENVYRSDVFYLPLSNFPFRPPKPMLALCVHKVRSSKERGCSIHQMEPGPGDGLWGRCPKADGMTYFGDWWRQRGLRCTFRSPPLRILPQLCWQMSLSSL